MRCARIQSVKMYLGTVSQRECQGQENPYYSLFPDHTSPVKA
jgi:hypothetical protein